MLTTTLSEFWNRHERWLGVVFFLAGIVWDLLTLRRIDNWVDNTILLVYFTALLVVIAAHGRLVGGIRVPNHLYRLRRWIRPAIQFLLGALLSALVVFYARSVTWTAGSAYLAALVIGLVGNEILWRRRASYPALVVALFLVGATIAAYLVPVVAGRLGLDLYRLALGLAAVPSALMVLLGRRFRAFRSRGRLYVTCGAVLVLALLLDTAYRQNWIPPVPLAVQAGGVFNSVYRSGDEFVAVWHSRGAYFTEPRYAREVYHAEGDTVFAFSAVFAPTGLRDNIQHVWQRRVDGVWILTDRIGYAVHGGRDDGYRGTTYKRHLTPGSWRILVETSDGRVLTRIPFTVTSDTVLWQPATRPTPDRPFKWHERRF